MTVDPPHGDERRGVAVADVVHADRVGVRERARPCAPYTFAMPPVPMGAMTW